MMFDDVRWCLMRFWIVEQHRYYEEDHPVVSSGSVFRGYRDCYYNKTLQDRACFAHCVSVSSHAVTPCLRFVAGAKRFFVGHYFAAGKARSRRVRGQSSVIALHALGKPCEPWSCRHTLGQSRTGRRHRPEFIQLVTWNVSWVHSFPSKPIPLESKVETKNNVLSTNWN